MTRRLRRKLRSIEERVDDAETMLAPDAVETVVAGAESDSAQTRYRAVRTLHELPIDVVPFDDVEPSLVALLKRGLTADRPIDCHSAELAARTLTRPNLSPSSLDALTEYTTLAAEMIDTRDPHLCTGGAVLIGPLLESARCDDPLLGSGHELDTCHLEKLLEHVAEVAQSENTLRVRINHVAPTLAALASVTESYGDRIEERIQEIDLEPYLCGPYRQSRIATAELLAALSDTHPSCVERYHDSLVSRLADESPQTAAHSATALARLAEGDGIRRLRPVIPVVNEALATADRFALKGLLEMLVTIVDVEPPWLSELSVDALRSLYTNNAVRNTLQHRARTVRVVGGYARQTAESVVDDRFVDFAFGTLHAAPPVCVGRRFFMLRSGVADALIGSPESITTVLERGSSAVVDEADRGELVSMLLDRSEGRTKRTNTVATRAAIGEFESDAEALLTRQLAVTACVVAARRSDLVRSWIIDAGRDPDRSMGERRCLADIQRIVASRASDRDEADPVLERAAERLSAADDAYLSAIGDAMRTTGE